MSSKPRPYRREFHWHLSMTSVSEFAGIPRRCFDVAASASAYREVGVSDAAGDDSNPWATALQRRLLAQTIDQQAQAMVTMGKLGGRLNMADAPSPSHTALKLIAVEATMAMTGRGVSMIAVAAGVTTRANSRSVPTACTAIVTVSPSRT